MFLVLKNLVLILNNKRNAINLVSFLPYKMAASFRHVIILIVPRLVIKPVYTCTDYRYLSNIHKINTLALQILSISE